jgi:hypothetical protein
MPNLLLLAKQGNHGGIPPCILRGGQRVKSMTKQKKAKGKEKLVLPLPEKFGGL